MFIKLVKSKTSENVQVYLVESYRDGGKIKHRTLKRYGVLQELQRDDPDILSKLKAHAKQLSELEASQLFSCTLDLNESNDHSSTFKNIGCVYLSHVIDRLNIKPLLDEIQSSHKIQYDLYDALRFLVVMRILYPGSKRSAHHKKDKLYLDFDLSLDDVYRSLGHLDKAKARMIQQLDTHMVKHYERDKSLVYYDVTNFYFESNETSDLRELGASKENVKHPIVTMGLYMDEHNYPISYDLFRGNTHDAKTLIPSFQTMQHQLSFKRCVVVADKGLNGGENIRHLLDAGHGYIFASKVRGSSQKVIDKVLDPEGYHRIGDGFKYKQVEMKRKVTYRNEMGRTKTFEVMENIVIFYSKNYDLKAKYERDKVLEKLEHYIAQPGQLKQKTKQGKFKYLKQVESHPETGEVMKPSLTLSIDEAKVNKDAQLDGYYLIASSEFTLSAEEIIQKYRGLWQIEKSFRMIKSELEGRPIYLSTDDHIKGHFLTCFVALLVSRILEKKLDGLYSMEHIQEGLREMNVLALEGDVFKITRYTNVQKAIQEALGVYLDHHYIRKETLNRRLKELT